MQSQRGDILIMTLFLLAAFVVMLAAWTQFAARQSHSLVDQEQEDQAFQIAEAGVAYTLFLLNRGGAEPATLIGTSLPARTVAFSDGQTVGSYQLSFTGEETALAVAATGYDQNKPERCQRIDAVIGKLTGELAEEPYYVQSFNQPVSVECAATPPTPRRGGRGGRGGR